MILVGVGIASGEYILCPYITSQVGLVFLWAAIVGLLTQYFINMEVERYTLATGETAITGFQRLWKPFGLVMVACAIVPNMWPGVGGQRGHHHHLPDRRRRRQRDRHLRAVR